MDEGKLGYGFTSANELEEVDIGPGDKPRPTFISKQSKGRHWLTSLQKGLAQTYRRFPSAHGQCFLMGRSVEIVLA
jgi:hypothetical protein